MSARKVLEARVAGTQGEFPRHPRVEPPTVKSLLHKNPLAPHCVSVNATSQEALKIMAEHDIGAVLVLDGSRLAGIFSERDHARSSLRAAQSAGATPLREAMTPCSVFATPTDSVQKCMSLMSENRLRYLAVQEGKIPIAILALEDLLNEMLAYLDRVFKENEMDQQVASLRGTYSC